MKSKHSFFIFVGLGLGICVILKRREEGFKKKSHQNVLCLISEWKVKSKRCVYECVRLWTARFLFSVAKTVCTDRTKGKVSVHTHICG